MRAYVSLWSADLLEVGRSIEAVGDAADGFHIDVMDGHFVPELLFGADFVSAVCRRTAQPVEVHLMVDEADRWIERFAKTGCAWIAIHLASSENAEVSLREIERQGARPVITLTLAESPEDVEPYLELVDRVLVMGTKRAVKGVAAPDIRTYGQVAELVRLRNSSTRRPDVIVDGGIRRESVPLLAEAGADGIIPGSLVLGSPEPVSVLAWIHEIDSTMAADP
jgi:ribulose-phosphate 3-epimerase